MTALSSSIGADDPLAAISQTEPVEAHGLDVEAVDAAAWDGLAAQFRDVIHEQTECFNGARWRQEQLRRLVFSLNGAVVGAVIARIITIPLTGTALAVVRWGPLWRKFGEPDQPAILGRIYAAMVEQLAKREGHFLVVFPRSDPEVSAVEMNQLAQTGFVAGQPTEAPERYFVNVDLSEEEVRKSLGQKWRYNLKKAEKNSLTTTFVEGEAGLGQFLDLYRDMLDRKQFLDLSPVDTLDSLMTAEDPALRPKIFIVSENDTPVAGAVIDCSGERAVYLYGATNDRALPLKAGYVLHWEVAKHLAEQSQIKWYDLGGGASGDCSLHQFKRGFVGKTGVISDVPPIHFYAGSKWADIVGRAVLFGLELKDRVQKTIHRVTRARS